jgi:hypothetical protein
MGPFPSSSLIIFYIILAVDYVSKWIKAKATRTNDANLVITWSRNPHAKTPIPGKPSKSSLIGV